MVKYSLRVVYNMDYEVVPMSCNIFDLLLNSTWDHFDLHQGKNVKVIMEFEVPKGLHYPLTWSNWFCSGRGKRGAMIEMTRAHGKKYYYNKILMILF